MTNDPMLEKWIEENQLVADGIRDAVTGGCSTEVVRASDLRAFMAGKRIVEDVPFAPAPCGKPFSAGPFSRAWLVCMNPVGVDDKGITQVCGCTREQHPRPVRHCGGGEGLQGDSRSCGCA